MKDSTFFDLQPLMRTNDAYYSVEGDGTEFRWNFCDYVSLDDTDAIAQDMQFLEAIALREEADGLIRPLTEMNLMPDETVVLYKEDSNQYAGVEIEYKSNEVC